jgi:XTP/dITP diphosphohydrolase
LTYAPKGAAGFGYDPVFYVEDCGCTSAELEPAHKNAISHRAQAMQVLMAHLGE